MANANMQASNQFDVLHIPGNHQLVHYGVSRMAPVLMAAMYLTAAAAMSVSYFMCVAVVGQVLCHGDVRHGFNHMVCQRGSMHNVFHHIVSQMLFQIDVVGHELTNRASTTYCSKLI